MTNKLLYLLLLSLNIHANINIPKSTTQLLVVSSKDFNTSIAYLQAYEKIDKKWKKYFEKIPVNLGRNGLGWGKGLLYFKHKPNEPIKQEGDGKAPAGLFQLNSFFGYKQHHFSFKYKQLSPDDLCIDDSDSKDYNKLIKSKDTKNFNSYEHMKREDKLYALGITIGHNQDNIKHAGSCIFIHIQRDKGSATSGCTSMKEETLFKLMKWLDASKNPLLLQLPSLYLNKGFN